MAPAELPGPAVNDGQLRSPSELAPTLDVGGVERVLDPVDDGVITLEPGYDGQNPTESPAAPSG